MREIITDAGTDYGKQIFQTLSGQLGWSHFVQIIAFDECRLKLIANKLRRVANE